MAKAVFFLGLCGLAIAGAGLDPAEEGRELAAELRSARPAEAIDVQGTIRFRDAEGTRRNAPFRYHTVLGTNSWLSVYETPGGEGLPRQKLVVSHVEQGANSYRLETYAGTNTVPEVRIYRGVESMVPFAGSDFWLADLGLEYLHWADHRIVVEAKIRMRKGRPCRVLESRNAASGEAGYSRVMSWIDRESGKPIIAEAFARDGKLLKEFEIGGVTKVNGVWELKNLEMRNVRADSRTVLEFRYDHPE